MLEQGIIRPNTSSFSALGLFLVKADDSSWFCIDYRALNDKTSMDKFPILLVNELHVHNCSPSLTYARATTRCACTQWTSRIEFFVMPFGLSNALPKFQALMNDVIWPFLRRFVLMFFDDILIYNSS